MCLQLRIRHVCLLQAQRKEFTVCTCVPPITEDVHAAAAAAAAVAAGLEPTS
jgi:hypothetical protein